MSFHCPVSLYLPAGGNHPHTHHTIQYHTKLQSSLPYYTLPYHNTVITTSRLLSGRETELTVNWPTATTLAALQYHASKLQYKTCTIIKLHNTTVHYTYIPILHHIELFYQHYAALHYTAFDYTALENFTCTITVLQ